MKLRILILFLLFLSIFIELTYVSFPLVFLFSYIIFSLEHRFAYLIPAAILMLIADAVFLNPIGSTLIFVTGLIFLIYLYAKYLGSKDMLVYILFGVLGAFSYDIIFGYSVEALFKWFLLFIIIWIVYRLIPKKYLSF